LQLAAAEKAEKEEKKDDDDTMRPTDIAKSVSSPPFPMLKVCPNVGRQFSTATRSVPSIEVPS
jgi:hypothetical protein